MTANSKRAGQAGFTLLEATLVIALGALAMIPITRSIAESGREVRYQNAASQIRQVGEAGRRYVQDNYATVVAATGSGPVSITLCQLQGLNSDCSNPATPLPAYLPASLSQTNVFGQTYTVRVRASGTYTDPVTGTIGTRLEAATVTDIPAGASAIPAADISHVAALAGGGAGYVTASDPTVIQGHSGSYSVPLAPLGAATGAGRLAFLAFFGDGDVVDDRLNRFQIPGRPEANRMHASIDMNANDIAGGRNLTFDGTSRLADPGNTTASMISSWGADYSARPVKIGGSGTTNDGLGVQGGIYATSEINTESRLGARLAVNSGCIPSGAAADCARMDNGDFTNSVSGIDKTGRIYNSRINIQADGYIDSQDGGSFVNPLYAPNFYYTSDIRAKTDLEPLTDALGRIERMGGYSFTWKKDGRRDIGLIAQEVAQTFPELVSVHPKTGLLTVAYPNMVAPLIEAVKELARRNDELTATVQQLKKENPK